MKIRTFIAFSVLLSFVSCGEKVSHEAAKLDGAGANFPAPLYGKWFKAFEKKHPGARISYDPIGSGGGVKNFVDHVVDFGASDTAMTEDEIERVDPGLGVQLLPMTAGCIVFIYNLPEVPQLRLSRKAYTAIFLGRITRWNDPLITQDNSDVKIPAIPITVVVRSDSSGVSFALTRHLSAISIVFSARTGISRMPDWLVGTRARGNGGIVSTVKSTVGAIGYLGYGSAKSENLSIAILENKAGVFVTPTTAAGQAALRSAPIPDDMIAWVPDPDAKGAYPVVTYTWMLCYKRYDKKKRDALVELLNFGLGEGQKDAEPLGYIPLPAPVIEKVKAAAQSIAAT